MKRVGRLPVVLPVALLLLAACAAGARRSGPAEPDMRVTVQNDLSPPRSLTIRVTTGTGQRMILGSVPPNSTRTLRFDDSADHGRYQLVAEAGPGSDVTSPKFTLSPGAEVVWMVQRNLLRFPDG